MWWAADTSCMKRVSMVAEYDAETAQPTHHEVMRTDGVSQAVLLVWGPVLGVPTLSWFDADRETVSALLDRVEAVENVRLVPEESGTYAFVERSGYEFADAVLELIADSQAVFVPPLVFEESGAIRFEAVGEHDRLGAFYRDLTGLVDVRIESVHTFHRRGSAADLTDRQHEALRTAASIGYYEVPRTGSVADVAAELDCAESTAGDLLRRAEAAVVSGFLAGASEVPPGE